MCVNCKGTHRVGWDLLKPQVSLKYNDDIQDWYFLMKYSLLSTSLYVVVYNTPSLIFPVSQKCQDWHSKIWRWVNINIVVWRVSRSLTITVVEVEVGVVCRCFAEKPRAMFGQVVDCGGGEVVVRSAGVC